MIEYLLTFARSARQDLEKLDAEVVNRVFPKIEALVHQPRPPGCPKLRGWKVL